MLVDVRTRFELPAFSHFLDTACRSAANTPQIVAGLVRYGEMSEATVRAILTTQVPPIVGVADLSDNDLGRFMRRNATVYVAMDIAHRYEAHPEERSDVRLQRLIVAVLMHEFVHWGDARTGGYRGETPAHAFDRAVFNGRVRRYWR